jgi:hypothetical protein
MAHAGFLQNPDNQDVDPQPWQLRCTTTIPTTLTKPVISYTTLNLTATTTNPRNLSVKPNNQHHKPMKSIGKTRQPPPQTHEFYQQKSIATTTPTQTHNISTKTNSYHHKPMKSIGKTQHLQ